MKTIPASKAKHRLNKLIDEIAASNQPVKISDRAGSAVLVPQELWDSIQETLYLSAIPGNEGTDNYRHENAG
jgi:antitoxin YefM